MFDFLELSNFEYTLSHAFLILYFIIALLIFEAFIDYNYYGFIKIPL
ncbi:hypothetical protein M472_11305 [Sphingobacterium paucimobilis HER1398]|uniref:Uncharacterized protein n=1 Tax=Sphingobacterium paucimobilis HER1398 TaxID=1346330 RepID=U2HVQ3_9SPHI|nr:hypothetical protein M472_11305 [Sphingobacterium paucimobilis HER1398]